MPEVLEYFSFNGTTLAAETTVETLRDVHLPRLVAAASAVSADFARLDQVPLVTTDPRG